jgi:hypothetical protein
MVFDAGWKDEGDMFVRYVFLDTAGVRRVRAARD